MMKMKLISGIIYRFYSKNILLIESYTILKLQSQNVYFN